MNDNPQQQQKPPGLRALLQSVLAAALGVQSSKNAVFSLAFSKARAIKTIRFAVSIWRLALAACNSISRR